MITFTCSCGKAYRFSPKFQGQSFRCSQCNQSLTIPRDESAPDIPATSAPDTSAPTPSSAVESAPISPLPENGPVVQEVLSEVVEDYPNEQTEEGLYETYSEPLDASYFGSGGVFELPFEGVPVSGGMGNVAASSSGSGGEEYYVVSNEEPVLLKDFAIQPPEDTGPPSEALSMVLGRAAVAEYLMQQENTATVRLTPVPVPNPGPSKRKKSRSSSSGSAAKEDATDDFILDHGSPSKKGPLFLALGVFAIIAVLGLFAVMFFSGKAAEEREKRNKTEQKARQLQEEMDKLKSEKAQKAPLNEK